jgi:hypothetical protein
MVIVQRLPQMHYNSSQQSNSRKKLTMHFSGGILLRRIAFHRAERLFVQITKAEGVLS